MPHIFVLLDTAIQARQTNLTIVISRATFASEIEIKRASYAGNVTSITNSITIGRENCRNYCRNCRNNFTADSLRAIISSLKFQKVVKKKKKKKK